MPRTTVDRIYRDRVERERLFDVAAILFERLRRILPIAAIATIPIGVRFGAVTAAALALGFGVGFLASFIFSHRTRVPPELSVLGTWAFTHAMVLVAIAAAGDDRSYLLVLAMLPSLLGSLTFPLRVAVLGVTVAVVTLAATVIAVDPHAIGDNPALLILPCALVVLSTVLIVRARDANVLTGTTAAIDPLTGLLDRRALQARLDEIETAHGAGGAIVLIDLDRLKAINDTRGHRCGDRIIVEVARRLSAALPVGGMLYRYGGDEFLAILGDRDPNDAVRCADQMRRAVAESPIEDIDVTVSVGVASDADATHDSLLSAADAALYVAKRDGRDRVSRVPDAGAAAAASAAVPDPGRATASAGRGAIGRHAQHGQARLILERTYIDSIWATWLTAGAVLVSALWLGWPFAAVVLAALILNALVLRLSRGREHVVGVLVASSVIPAVAMPICQLVADPPLLWALAALAIPLINVGAGVGWSEAIATWAINVVAILVSVALVASDGLRDSTVWIVPIMVTTVVFLVAYVIGRATVDLRSTILIDPVSGALNRLALDARRPEFDHATATSHNPAAVMIVDVDDFKSVNDDHGHEHGDAVLAAVVAEMRAQLRPWDTIYRIGGDEFVVLLENSARHLGQEVAERIRTHVAGGGGPVPVTVSIGVGCSDGTTSATYESLFADADAALYQAKHGGRNRVAVAAAG